MFWMPGAGSDLQPLRCREARMDASKARREDAKARDASPDVVHLPGGGDPMGASGDDSFAAARAR